MNVEEIKDPKVRQRIEDADAKQNVPKRGKPTADVVPVASLASKVKRLRQSAKPLMNKLEMSFYAKLLAERIGQTHVTTEIRIQAKRYRLGNGIWYKPDFTAAKWVAKPGDDLTGRFCTTETAWEVKGPRAFRGGFENLKVAASLYPEVRWLLVWKDKETGQWREQVMLP